MRPLAPVLRPTLGRPIVPGGGGGAVLRPLFDRVRSEFFGAGEAGIYMPSVHESFLRGDLYQDAAGTTPVTAVGQPVGLWLDRSRGLELGPERWDDANVLLFGEATRLSPGVYRLVDTDGVYDAVRLPLEKDRTYEVSVQVTRVGAAAPGFKIEYGPGGQSVGFSNITTTTYRAVLRVTSTNPEAISIARNAGSDLDIANVSVRELPGNHVSQPTAANRPVLQQDANGIYVLRFDGVDDWMVTPSIDFTVTDKMTVVAGVYKASDADIRQLVALGVGDVASVDGSFAIWSPSSAAAANYRFDLRGDTPGGTGYTATTFAAPIASVLAVSFDIAGESRSAEVAPRVNGATPTLTAAGSGSAGVGDFGDHSLYIGSRSGSFYYVHGDIYGLIVCGAAKSLAQIEQAEALINRYTRAF